MRALVLDTTRTNMIPETRGKAGFVVEGMERLEVLVATEEGKTNALEGLKEECERKWGGVAWERMRRHIEVVVV